MQLPTDERINWRDLDISAISSVDQCQAYVLRCMRDLHNVAESITRRQDDAEAGEALDLGKLRNMQAARQGLGRTHQALNMHLGKLGRQERAAKGGAGRTIEAHFLTVVRESVDETVFLDWRREAEKRGAL